MNTGERRRLIVLVSIAGVLVVGAVSKFTVFNGGGGSKATTSTLTDALEPGATDSSTTPTSEASRSTSPPATFDVFATKNPFEPVDHRDADRHARRRRPPPGARRPARRRPAGRPRPRRRRATTRHPVPRSRSSTCSAAGGTTQAKVQVGSTVYTVGVGNGLRNQLPGRQPERPVRPVPVRRRAVPALRRRRGHQVGLAADRSARTTAQRDVVLRFLTAGESHGPALVVIVEGLPAGLPVLIDDIGAELARRRLGYGRGPRMRFERDELEFLGGIRHGRTLGFAGRDRDPQLRMGDGQVGRRDVGRARHDREAAHPAAARSRRPRGDAEVRVSRRA